MRAALLSLAVLLSGCGNDWEPPMADQCLRTELFQRCLAAVPAGPVVTGKENPWNEVVSSCESTAYYRAIRNPAQIKPECRSR